MCPHLPPNNSLAAYEQLARNFIETEIFKNLEISLTNFNQYERKFLDKVLVWLDSQNSVLNIEWVINELMSLSDNDFKNKKINGKSASIIKDSIVNHFISVYDSLDFNGDLLSQLYDTGYFLVNDISKLNTEKIDEYISKDLEKFLIYSDSRDAHIISKRLGVNIPNPMTLEEIGNSLDSSLTRERIRQIESRTLTELQDAMRIPKGLITELIMCDIDILLCQSYPLLSKKFSKPENLLNFFAAITDINKNILLDIYKPKLNVHSILGEWFLDNKGPISFNNALDLIMKTMEVDEQIANNAIEHAIINSELKVDDKIDGSYLSPSKLTKSYAIIQSALNFPDGTGYKNLQDNANEQGYCISEFPLTRLDYSITEAVNMDYIVQSDRGTYKHIKFVDIKDEDIQKILNEIKRILSLTPYDSVNLKIKIYEESEKLKDFDYFYVRHICRNNGKDSGIYFNGKSGADTVSLKEEIDIQSQLVTILNLFKESGSPLSRNDIATKIRSSSINHASFYINQLIEKNEIVRIDDLRYTTAKRAFFNANTKELIDDIFEKLIEYQKPVEIGVITSFLNNKYHFNYHKAWYLHLCRNQASLLKSTIYTYHNLISLNELSDISIHTEIRHLIEMGENINEFERIYEKISAKIVVEKIQVRHAINNIRREIAKYA